MSFTPPNYTPYISAAQTDARPAGPINKRFPLPQGCPIRAAAYAFDQAYEMKMSSFPPAAFNKSSSDSSLGAVGSANAILTDYSTPSPTYNGLAKFSGSFAIVPATWNDFQTQNITFPGIRDTAYTGGVRDPKALGVTIRIQNDYYVLDPGNVLGSGCSAGGGPANAASVTDSGSTAVKCVYSLGDIPEIRRTPFGFLVSTSMLTSGEVTGLVKRGGITGWLETVPSTERYQTWIAYAVANGWNSTVWDGLYADPDSSATTHQGVSTIAQYCFENSRLSVYQGNIIQRSSFYTLAN